MWQGALHPISDSAHSRSDGGSLVLSPALSWRGAGVFTYGGGASFKPPTVEVTSKHLTESRCRVVLLLPPFVTLLRLLSDGGSLSSVHESLLEKATLSLKRISIEFERRFDGPKLAFQSVAFVFSKWIRKSCQGASG